MRVCPLRSAPGAIMAGLQCPSTSTAHKAVRGWAGCLPVRTSAGSRRGRPLPHALLPPYPRPQAETAHPPQPQTLRGGQSAPTEARAKGLAASLASLQAAARRVFPAILLQAFTLTFLAEWGDRSQIATIGAHKGGGLCSLGGYLGVVQAEEGSPGTARPAC